MITSQQIEVIAHIVTQARLLAAKPVQHIAPPQSATDTHKGNQDTAWRVVVARVLGREQVGTLLLHETKQGV
jgi:hypothetical protein